MAVDSETGEVGLAAATCNPGIQFIAGVVPGSGVVAAQPGDDDVSESRGVRAAVR